MNTKLVELDPDVGEGPVITTDGVGEGVGEGEAVGDGDAVGDGEAVGAGEAVGEGLGDVVGWSFLPPLARSLGLTVQPVTINVPTRNTRSFDA